LGFVLVCQETVFIYSFITRL